MGYRLGIDLGTTFTAAAYLDDQQPRMVELGYRHVSMPSVLLVADGGEVLVGEAAERRAAAEPERVVREFKRRLGDGVPMMVAGRAFSATELQTMLLRWVLDFAAQRLEPPCQRVVITHPADWSGFKLGLIRTAAADAGVPDAVLCPEPVAAAIAYAARRKVPVGSELAVYDLGGGTFDVAVLRRTVSGFEILGSPLGIEHLGGSDFDEMIFGETLTRLGIGELDGEDPPVARALAALRRECIEAKEALSTDVSTEITSMLPGAMRTIRLTRGELDELIRPSVDQTIETTRRALRLAGVADAELDCVVLVGGSSRIPLVTERLTRELGVPIALDTYPKNDIALGAVLYADHARAVAAGPVPAAGEIDRPEPEPVSRQAAAPEPAPVDPAPAPIEVPAVAAEPPVDPTELPVEAPLDAAPAAARTPRRRRRVVLVVGAIVLALAAGAGIAVQRWGSERATGESPATGASVDASTAATPAPPDPARYGLPVGPPISEDQLVVPVTTTSGATTRLLLVDTVRPGSERDLGAIGGGDKFGIGLSLDRRTLTYIDAAENAVRAMPASGGGGKLLFRSPAGCGRIRHASWSPTDPQTFVLECEPSGGPKRLVVVGLDGAIRRELDSGQPQAGDPTISPDGRSVAFWGSSTLSDGDGGSLFVLPLAGTGTPRAVTSSGPGIDADPSWSPDGASLAFRRKVNSSPVDDDVMVVPIGGGTARSLLRGPTREEKPSWAPGGTAVVAVSNRGSDGKPSTKQRLLRLDTGGGEPVALGAEHHHVSTPTWWRR